MPVTAPTEEGSAPRNQDHLKGDQGCPQYGQKTPELEHLGMRWHLSVPPMCALAYQSTQGVNLEVKINSVSEISVRNE